MNALAATLIAWIVVQTGLLPPALPEIAFAPKAKLAELAFGKNAPEGGGIRALYSRNNQTIYLREDWNPDDLRDRSELLHELVHHVQAFNEVPAPCGAAREMDAYHLQLRWLIEQGVKDPYAFLDLSELLSTCRDRDAD